MSLCIVLCFEGHLFLSFFFCFLFQQNLTAKLLLFSLLLKSFAETQKPQMANPFPIPYQFIRSFDEPERVIADLIAFHEVSPSLLPKQSLFISNTGEETLMLLLDGTLPIPIKSKIYYFPVNIWIQKQYPNVPPILFLISTSTIKIKYSHPNVDQTGQCHFHCTQSWHRNYNLVTLLRETQEGFSLSSPMYAASSPQQKSPPPRAHQPPSREPSPQPPQPPQPTPEQRKRSTLSEKLIDSYMMLCAEKAEEIDGLMEDQSPLVHAFNEKSKIKYDLGDLCASLSSQIALVDQANNEVSQQLLGQERVETGEETELLGSTSSSSLLGPTDELSAQFLGQVSMIFFFLFSFSFCQKRLSILYCQRLRKILL